MTKAGNITASGNISSSGNIESNTIQIGDSSITTPSYNLHIRDTNSVNAVLEATGNGNATLELKNNQTPDWVIRNKFSQGGLKFTANHDVLHLDDDGTATISGSLVLIGTGVSGNITASGDISASGDIFGDDITAATKFVGTELESSTNITLDATGDIVLSADGDQIAMSDGTTTRFTFNVDSTPQIDVAGDLIIDPTGGDVGVDGRILSYTNSSYPNYAVGGSQGYHTYYMIPAHKFEGEASKYQSYSFSGNSVSFTSTMNAGTSFVIPKGYRLTSCMIPMSRAGNGVKIYTTSGSGWCAPSLVKSMTAVRCPSITSTVEAAYLLAKTDFTSGESGALIGNDITQCIVEVSVANKDVINGAFFTMEPIA